MRTILFSVVIALATLSLAGPSTAETHQAKSNTARQVAESWLSIVDEGRYADSWDVLARLLQKEVTREEWVERVTALRTIAGTLDSRKLVGARYAKNLPGAPPGEYVVVQYRSAFSQEKSVRETVVPMLDSDGKWRVSSYFIQAELPQ